MVQFFKDLRALSKLPRSSRYSELQVFEYPFDLELLTLSPLYRKSRKDYLDLGGRFAPRLSSTMRSLSAADLFADEIDYTPSATELNWFAANSHDVYSPNEEIAALDIFSSISLFHEQNHRIVWRILPPAPTDEFALIRYLNFAESLVVMLDLALADQVGAKLSLSLERMKVLYRTGSAPKAASGPLYREYLLSAMFATYLLLELTNPEDILKAVNYVRTETRALNRAAVARALDINELFTRVTNPMWQEREWKNARTKLTRMHKGSKNPSLTLPKDPLDFDDDLFALASHVLNEFEINRRV